MKKANFQKFFFLLVIAFSIFLIFYLTIFLNIDQKTTNESQKINQIKVKAENKTYTRTIALNTTNQQISPTPSFTPSPTPIILAQNQNEIENVATSSSSTNELIETPTPTEIILAYNNATDESNLSLTSTPRITLTTIPESGNFLPLLIIFGFSLIIIIFSLIY